MTAPTGAETTHLGIEIIGSDGGWRNSFRMHLIEKTTLRRLKIPLPYQKTVNQPIHSSPNGMPQGIITKRKPTASEARFGGNRRRLAERAPAASAIQWPPRMTRSVPVDGPLGSIWRVEG